MEPRIQYAQTKDGMSIAYWTLGEGLPLVYMYLAGFSHIQLEWEVPAFRRAYERMAQKRMIVRYDSRGSGLSARDVTEYSLEADLLALAAVVGCLGSERGALLPAGGNGPVAIAYAVRHPEKVSHLVLWCTYARASDLWVSPQVKGLMGTVASTGIGGPSTAILVEELANLGAHTMKYAALMRE